MQELPPEFVAKMFLGIERVGGVRPQDAYSIRESQLLPGQWGVFANVDIPNRHIIGKYRGQVSKTLGRHNEASNYLFNTSSGRYVDGDYLRWPSKCNIISLINGVPEDHIERSNALFLDEGEVRAHTHGRGPIKAGSEIILCYGDEYFEAFDEIVLPPTPKKETRSAGRKKPKRHGHGRR